MSLKSCRGRTTGIVRYRGTNQFWFGVQAPDKRNYGMELNNHPNELNQSSQLLPATDFKVYNLTIIGSGASSTNVNGGVNAAIALRPWVGPKIYNAIFTDFNAQGVLPDTQNGVTATQAVTGAYAQLHNTLSWDFTTGSGNQIISNTATNLGRNTVATSCWTDLSLTNEIADPMLTSISRTNIGAHLDPRPQAGSPAYSDYATVPNDGFLTPVNYRGAFASGRGNWIADWTALSECCIVTGEGGVIPRALATVTAPASPPLSASIVGGYLQIVVASQPGFTYQLESRPDFSTTYWSADGPSQAGTGGNLTLNATLSGVGTKFFRIRVQ